MTRMVSLLLPSPASDPGATEGGFGWGDASPAFVCLGFNCSSGIAWTPSLFGGRQFDLFPRPDHVSSF